MTNVIGADLDLAYPNLTDGKSFGLGDRFTDQSGNIFVFGQANGAITQYAVCLIDNDYAAIAEISTTNSAGARGEMVGVAQAELADDEYGWFQVYGVGDFLVKASCSANAVLNTTASAGALDDDSTTGSEVIDRIFLTSNRATGTGTAEGVLNFPTVGATEA